jgi:ABC-type nitrate/sulfonate/bicarbonate transport system substrate-binding protein
MPEFLTTGRLQGRGARIRILYLLLLLLAPWVSPAAEPLVLALSKTPLSLPFYIAESQGYFAAEGVDVEIHELIGGHRTMQQVLQGKADLATSSEAVVMFTSYERQDVAILASFVTSMEDVKVIAGANSQIRSAADLTGKRVGTIIGSASHYYLDTLALLNGSEPRDIALVALQPEEMASALQKAEVDAIAVWQPYAYRTERQVAGSRPLADDGFYILSFNLVAAKTLLGKRDEDVVKLLRALQRAEDYISQQPDKAKALLSDRLALDPVYVDWLWSRYRYRLTLDQSLINSLESEARWARLGGHVQAQTSPDYQQLIHANPLRQVNPAAVGIVE